MSSGAYVPFSQWQKPVHWVMICMQWLHSSQFPFSRSSQRLAGQAGSFMYFSVMGRSVSQAGGDRLEFNWVFGEVLFWEGVIGWGFGWLARILIGGFG